MYYDSSIIEQAKNLRRKGYSYLDICKILDISKSTAHVWTNSVKNDPEIIRKKRKLALLQSIATKSKNKQILTQLIHAEVKQYLDTLRAGEGTRLQVALLYWCEGEKNSNRVVFMNSDSDLVLTFISLMRKSFKLEESKWRVVLHLHEYHDVDQSVKYWSSLLKIPVNQFNKPYTKPHTGKRKHEDYKGCASLRYSDYKLAIEISSLAKEYVKIICSGE